MLACGDLGKESSQTGMCLGGFQTVGLTADASSLRKPSSHNPWLAAARHGSSVRKRSSVGVRCLVRFIIASSRILLETLNRFHELDISSTCHRNRSILAFRFPIQTSGASCSRGKISRSPTTKVCAPCLIINQRA